MTVLRWILGGIFLLVLSGWLVTVLSFVVSGDDRWGELGLKLRRYCYLVGLFWFNTEVWGRVVLTIVRW
ncbi:MAG: hypothetical protein HEQ39_02670 [Rhizobacter sp.]